MKRTFCVLFLLLITALFVSGYASRDEFKINDHNTLAPVVIITPTPITTPAPTPTPTSVPIPTIPPTPQPTPTPEPTPYKPEFVPIWTEDDVSYLTKTVFGEAGGIASLTEQSAVVWCVLNCCDRDGQSIEYEVTYPERFQGYLASNPEPEYLRDLVIDVLTRWEKEKQGEADVGRTLPSNYYYFGGNGVHNYFRTDWKAPYITWDWSLPSPYES